MNWPAILVISVVALLVLGVFLVIRKYPKTLFGCYELLKSPSGVFGLLTLFAITFVTLKQPTVGGVAFAAFVSIVPAILTWVEHKETMVQLTMPPFPTPVAFDNNLPPRGQV